MFPLFFCSGGKQGKVFIGFDTQGAGRIDQPLPFSPGVRLWSPKLCMSLSQEENVRKNECCSLRSQRSEDTTRARPSSPGSCCCVSISWRDSSRCEGVFPCVAGRTAAHHPLCCVPVQYLLVSSPLSPRCLSNFFLFSVAISPRLLRPLNSAMPSTVLLSCCHWCVLFFFRRKCWRAFVQRNDDTLLDLCTH